MTVMVNNLTILEVQICVVKILETFKKFKSMDNVFKLNWKILFELLLSKKKSFE